MCPQCREEHKVPPGGFPLNRYIKDISNIYKQIQTEEINKDEDAERKRVKGEAELGRQFLQKVCSKMYHVIFLNMPVHCFS